MKNRGPALFALFFAVVFFVAVWTARHWYFTAKLFPIFAGIPGFLLAGVQIWRELTGWELRHEASGVHMDEAYDDSMDAALRWRRTMLYFVWLIVTAVGIWAFGLPLALSVSLGLWVRFEGGRSWLMSFTFCLATFLIVWGVFTKGFGLGWPPGEIFRVFGYAHFLT